MNDRDLPSHLSQEIATSPTFMVGCQAQPRVGTHKVK